MKSQLEQEIPRALDVDCEEWYRRREGFWILSTRSPLCFAVGDE